MVRVREAVYGDLSEVYSLIAELAAFEKAPDEPSVPPEKFQSFFGDLYECLVAEDDGQIVGMALFYWGYSTWKGKMLYLEDLVVRESCRGRKIGSMLFNEVMRIAQEGDAGQVRWQVLDWNEPAIRMYRKVNADFYDDWLTCKMEKETINNYKNI